MSCSHHQGRTAPEVCSKCAAPGCSECMEQVDGVFYCTNCLLLRLQEAESEAYDLETTTAVRNVRLETKRRIRRNWILTGVFSVVGVPAMANLVVEDNTFPTVVKLFAAPIAGIVAVYLIWAALWGIPAAWKWWKGLFESFSALIFSSAFGWLILAVSFFVIPLYLGYLYGVFGGAINEYRKARKVVDRTMLANSA